jgi:hypothetical protein
MKRATDATCGENEEYVFDVGDFADKVRKRNDRQHGNEQNERSYTLPDPQPGKGEVWIRQAKDDMVAAKISTKMPSLTKKKKTNKTQDNTKQNKQTKT